MNFDINAFLTSLITSSVISGIFAFLNHKLAQKRDLEKENRDKETKKEEEKQKQNEELSNSEFDALKLFKHNGQIRHINKENNKYKISSYDVDEVHVSQFISLISKKYIFEHKPKPVNDKQFEYLKLTEKGILKLKDLPL